MNTIKAMAGGRVKLATQVLPLETFRPDHLPTISWKCKRADKCGSLRGGDLIERRLSCNPNNLSTSICVPPAGHKPPVGWGTMRFRRRPIAAFVHRIRFGNHLQSPLAQWARTMGMVQRNFLDLVEVSRPRLEVALVVDGTESMGTESDRDPPLVTPNGGGSEPLQGSCVVQLVVFRDEGSPSGAIAFPLEVPNHGFTSDSQRLNAAIDQIKAEPGAPYFPRVDRSGH